MNDFYLNLISTPTRYGILLSFTLSLILTVFIGTLNKISIPPSGWDIIPVFSNIIMMLTYFYIIFLRENFSDQKNGYVSNKIAEKGNTKDDAEQDFNELIKVRSRNTIHLLSLAFVLSLGFLINYSTRETKEMVRITLAKKIILDEHNKNFNKLLQQISETQSLIKSIPPKIVLVEKPLRKSKKKCNR